MSQAAYHALSFYFWGQDLYGTNPGQCERQATDFDLGKLHKMAIVIVVRDYLVQHKDFTHF